LTENTINSSLTHHNLENVFFSHNTIYVHVRPWKNENFGLALKLVTLK